MQRRMLSPEDMVERRPGAVCRVNGYCQGLLPSDGNGYIIFLHNTVAYFLATQEMSCYMDEKIAPGFRPVISILKSTLAECKTTDYQPYAWGEYSIM